MTKPTVCSIEYALSKEAEGIPFLVPSWFVVATVALAVVPAVAVVAVLPVAVELFADPVVAVVDSSLNVVAAKKNARNIKSQC